jgi:hypothetical protein
MPSANPAMLARAAKRLGLTTETAGIAGDLGELTKHLLSHLHQSLKVGMGKDNPDYLSKFAKKDPPEEEHDKGNVVPNDMDTDDSTHQPKPKSPRKAKTAKPGAAPSAAPAPGSPPPKAVKPKTVKAPKAGKATLKAAKPGAPAVDHNDTTGAKTKTATKDINIRGKINGKSTNMGISAGQVYHTKKLPEGLQLVMPGLFGKFFVDPGDTGKL